MKEKDYFSEFTLMIVATIGAFYICEYPEGVAVMLFYTIGELFQDKAVDKAKRNIGAVAPTAAPYLAPQIKPQRSTGRCIGQSIAPKLCSCPVRNGKTSAIARNIAEYTSFFIKIFFRFISFLLLSVKITASAPSCGVWNRISCRRACASGSLF